MVVVGVIAIRTVTSGPAERRHVAARLRNVRSEIGDVHAGVVAVLEGWR